MTILAHIQSWFRKRRPQPLSEWFFVEFDNERVVIRAAPPGKEAWEQSFRWDSVVRVCFKDEGPYASDGLYVYTSGRSESYAIPTEANGGVAFFGAMAARNLFPPEIMAKAVSSTDGGLYCWPPQVSPMANQSPGEK